MFGDSDFTPGHDSYQEEPEWIEARGILCDSDTDFMTRMWQIGVMYKIERAYEVQ